MQRTLDQRQQALAHELLAERLAVAGQTATHAVQRDGLLAVLTVVAISTDGALDAMQETPLLSMKEAAAFLGVSRRTICRLLEQQQLRAVYVSPRTPRLHRDELERFLHQDRNGAA